MPKRRGVFIDRDGVLVRSNRAGGKPIAVTRLDEFRLLPGVEAAFAELRAAGFATIIVTNQPDIAKGLIPMTIIEAMHARLAARLKPDAIELCPHAQTAGCDCRKPRPGMLLRAAARLSVDLALSVMIGDRASDIEAGQAAGSRCIFIDRHYGEAKPRGAFKTAKHFPAAVAMILRPPD